MTEGELELLHRYIDRARHYLEFGAGESTIYACAAPGVERVDSVESSEGFVAERLLPDPAVARALESGKLKLHLIDIGETKLWGKPTDDRKRHLWPNYSLSVFTRPIHPDTILVDGRFRVACTASCLLNAPEESVILIHDFWIRSRLRLLRRFLEVVDRVETLGVFRKRAGIDPRRLQALIERYQYRPDDRLTLGEVGTRMRNAIRIRR